MNEMEKYHFIGIGGIGMSGLARILLKKNISVSGSDLASSYVTESLCSAGAQVSFGHSPQNVPQHATVVYSSDIKKDNPEFLAALNLKCPMMHRSDLLVHLMKSYKTLAIAGTHGKTTTSALLTWVLKHAGKDPSFAVGGMITHLQSNAGYGEGDFFVAEADESDGTFLKYQPYAAIVTNIDTDHLNNYDGIDGLVEAFSQFMHKIEAQEYNFWCGDDPYLTALNPKGVSYGFNENCRLRISQFYQKSWSLFLTVEYKGRKYTDLQLPLIGKHNALNGAAVFGLALDLGIPEGEIRKAFLSFGGVLRRCEKKGELHNILFLDDYAHHPTEIKTTLQGIRQAVNGRRILAVFQPHRYSRTKDCLGLYKEIFDDADEIIVTDIFGAGETPIPELSSKNVIKEIEENGLRRCHFFSRHELSKGLAEFACTHDVIITLGAGDVTKISHEIMELFKQKPPKKLKIGILFGGRSTEHEVTFLSASHICNCISADLYDVRYFGVTKQGSWISGLDSMQRLKQQDLPSTEFEIDPLVFKELLACDVCIPVFHGPYGEDGTIQGFFETIHKAYVGADHTSAAICMDKALTKYLMQAKHIPTLPFVEINQKAWKKNKESFLREIEQKLQFPVFVKPVHLGSTVGVQKVEEISQLHFAIQTAFQYDYKLIVEQGLTQVREIEFAVLGNEEPYVFPPGEVLTNGKLYDFEGKYSPNGVKTNPKADLSEDKIHEGMKLAHAAYQAVGCTGMSRVDFFLDSHENFWLNEINPIPGFTPNSLYPKICEVNGLSGKELLDRLIIYALERKRRNAILCRSR